MLVNKYNTKCCICQTRLKAGEGFAFKSSSFRWQAACSSSQCINQAGISEEEIKNLQKRSSGEKIRKMTANGEVYTPYEPESIPLLRSLPGGKWNKVKKCWSFSLKYEDRKRVLEIGERLGLNIDPSLKEVEEPEEVKEALGRAERLGCLYPFQIEGIKWLSAREKAILADDMGCISGDTTVVANRAGGARKRTVKSLYEKFNNIKGRKWDLSIPTKIQSLNEKNGELNLNEVKKVLYKGVQETYILETFSGKTIRATKDHEFITNSGWTELANLNVGDIIFVNGKGICNNCDEEREDIVTGKYAKFRGTCKRCIYRVKRKNKEGTTIRRDGYEYMSVVGHPRESTRSIPKHRLIMEAHINGYTLDEWVILLNSGKFDQKKHKIISDEEHVHHKNHDRRDNRVENLEILSKKEHHRRHDKDHSYNNLGLFKYKEEKIKSITYYGKEDVYDIVMSDPNRNFVANGIIVHNCGKTLETLVSIPKDKGCIAVVPACVKYNWLNEIKKWRPDLKTQILSGTQKFTKDDYKIMDYIIKDGPQTTKIISSALKINLPTVRQSLKRLKEENYISAFKNGRTNVYKSNVEENPCKKEGEENFRWPGPGEIIITNMDILPASLEGPTKPKEPKNYGFSRKETDNYDKKIELYKKEKIKFDAMLAEQAEHAKNVVLVVDEAHQAKNYKTQRTKKITSISKLVDKTWFLTGTPLLNHPFDLWGILNAGNMAKDVFNWTTFLRVFNGMKGPFGGYEFGNPSPVAAEMLRKVCLRRTKQEVLSDLPPKVYQNLIVECPKKLKPELDEFWEDQKEYGLDELPPFEAFSRLRAELAKEKVVHAIEQIKLFEEQDTPLIVFSAHQDPVNKIAERAGWEVITGFTPAKKRQQIVDDFQSGKLKGIAATIEAAGVGLTMTRAAHVLFLDLDWTPALNTQAEDRLHRIGASGDKVHIIRMIFDHPMDNHVINLLSKKTKMIETAIESKIQVDKEKLNAKVDGFDAQEIKEETDEEFQSRMKAIKDEAEKIERDRLLNKVQKKYNELSNKEGTNIPVPVITNKIEASLKDAWNYMLSVCDGANEKDGMGFNKPDAAVAHWMMPVLDDNKSLQVAWLILRKYKRQLSGTYPELY